MTPEHRCQADSGGSRVARKVSQRIFHEMTAPQIIEQTFAEYGHTHENLLQQDYPVLQYTVQYAETDLDFVTRMMAMYGINRTVKHKKGSHDIVLFDDLESLPEVPGGSRPLRQTDRQYRDNVEHLQDWTVERRMTMGRVSMVDHNFKTPTKAIPRAGMEVIVEFLSGDPSHPIVTGCVYNGDNKPPFELPGAGQIAGMKSNFTPGGGGYNELVFDDSQGEEECASMRNMT